jgi:hypothetical protein
MEGSVCSSDLLAEVSPSLHQALRPRSPLQRLISSFVLALQCE